MPTLRLLDRLLRVRVRVSVRVRFRARGRARARARARARVGGRGRFRVRVRGRVSEPNLVQEQRVVGEHDGPRVTGPLGKVGPCHLARVRARVRAS